MAESRKYNAGLNRKGLDGSVSEDQARHMASHQGHTYLFLVAAHSGAKTIAEDGTQTVQLVMDNVELVPAEHEERVRRLQRALYLGRPDAHGQEAFEEATPGDLSVEDAASAVDAVVQTDEKGEPTGVWDGNPDAPLDTPEDRGDDGLSEEQRENWPGDDTTGAEG